MAWTCRRRRETVLLLSRVSWAISLLSCWMVWTASTVLEMNALVDFISPTASAVCAVKPSMALVRSLTEELNPSTVVTSVLIDALVASLAVQAATASALALLHIAGMSVQRERCQTNSGRKNLVAPVEAKAVTRGAEDGSSALRYTDIKLSIVPGAVKSKTSARIKSVEMEMRIQVRIGA